MSEANRLGAKLTQLREDRELSLAQLAEQSGCHPEVLKGIEAGELIPSLTPLMQISRALGVRLGTLLDDEPHDGPVVIKKDDSPRILRFSGKESGAAKSNLDFYALGAGKKDRHMEPFVIEVQPREAVNIPNSSHEGEEFLYVLDGRIEVVYGADRYELETGESIYYDSVVPHDVHAQGCEAKVLAVVYAPV